MQLRKYLKFCHFLPANFWDSVSLFVVRTIQIVLHVVRTRNQMYSKLYFLRYACLDFTFSQSVNAICGLQKQILKFQKMGRAIDCYCFCVLTSVSSYTCGRRLSFKKWFEFKLG